MTAFTSLRDITQAQAEIHGLLQAGSTFGEIGERVAAKITGSIRVTGKERDLLCPAEGGWVRPADPTGLAAPGPQRMPYATAMRSWALRDQKRYRDWRNAPERIGEVKCRQLDRTLDLHQTCDTRGAGPATPLFPLVDFFVFIIFDLDGDIAMARQLELAEVIDYAARSDVRGAWNYKVAISLDMTEGTDLTVPARAALRTLSPATGARARRGA